MEKKLLDEELDRTRQLQLQALNNQSLFMQFTQEMMGVQMQKQAAPSPAAQLSGGAAPQLLPEISGVDQVALQQALMAHFASLSPSSSSSSSAENQPPTATTNTNTTVATPTTITTNNSGDSPNLFTQLANNLPTGPLAAMANKLTYPSFTIYTDPTNPRGTDCLMMTSEWQTALTHASQMELYIKNLQKSAIADRHMVEEIKKELAKVQTQCQELLKENRRLRAFANNTDNRRNRAIICQDKAGSRKIQHQHQNQQPQQQSSVTYQAVVGGQRSLTRGIGISSAPHI